MTKEEIQSTGKSVIEDVVKNKKHVNASIISKVSDKWTFEQVKRLVEFVNVTLFNVYYKKLDNKKFAFELADAEKIKHESKFFFKDNGLLKKVASVDDYRKAIVDELEGLSDEAIQKVASAALDMDGDSLLKGMISTYDPDYGYEEYKIAKCINELTKKALAPTGARMKQSLGLKIDASIKSNALQTNKMQSPSMSNVKLGEELDKKAFFDPGMASGMLNTMAEPIATGLFGASQVGSFSGQRMAQNMIGQNNRLPVRMKIKTIGNEAFGQIKNNFMSPLGGNVDFRNYNNGG